MTNLEWADWVEDLWSDDCEAHLLPEASKVIRNLHTENTALRVTEDNLRQELQECQDQRRAAFRRIEELDAMRAQIGQGVPVAWKHDCAVLLANDVELWVDACPHCGKPRHHPAPQQKPLTDEQQIAEALRKHGFALVKTATGYDVMKLGPCIAHGIGEKK